MKRIVVYVLGIILAVGMFLTGDNTAEAAKGYDCELIIKQGVHTGEDGSDRSQHAIACGGDVIGIWTTQGPAIIAGAYRGSVVDGGIYNASPGKKVLVKLKKMKKEEKEEKEKKSVPYDIVKQNDSSIKKGQTKVKTKGKNGVRTIIYKVTYINGKKTDRTKKSNKITTEPVDEVVLIGTKVESTSSNSGNSNSSSSKGNSSNSSSGKGNTTSSGSSNSSKGTSSGTTSSSSGSNTKSDQVNKDKETSQETVKDNEKSNSKDNEKSNDKDKEDTKDKDKEDVKDKDKGDKAKNELSLTALKHQDKVEVKEKDDKYYAVYKDKDGKTVEQEIEKEDAETLIEYLEDKEDTQKEEQEETQVKDSEQEKSSFGILWIVLVVLVLGLGGYGTYYYYGKKK